MPRRPATNSTTTAAAKVAHAIHAANVSTTNTVVSDTAVSLSRSHQSVLGEPGRRPHDERRTGSPASKAASAARLALRSDRSQAVHSNSTFTMFTVEVA
jgi:hypothetical protein